MESLKTHPWITFRLRVPQDHLLWLQLGELASKCEHLAGVPLRPDVAQNLHRLYLAKGVLATTAIEGNTLSEEQVLEQVQGTLKLPPSQHYLQQEVENIIEGCHCVRELLHALPGGIEDGVASMPPAGTQKGTVLPESVGLHSRDEITPALIRKYNEIVLKDLEVDEGVLPGSYREHSVTVGTVYRGAPARDLEPLMEALCRWLNGPDFKTDEKDLAVPYAAIKAVVAHIYLAWIHPFGDGNGRTARLLEFHILCASGVPLPAAHLLSDHYNLTRTRYYRELDRASKSGGDVIPFLKYAIQGFLDGIRKQLQLVRVQQMAVAWENYVHDRFRAFRTSPTQKRRRDLVLELSRHEGWKTLAEVLQLSPAIAAEYARAGDRMLQRDVNALAKLKLVQRQHGKVRARTEIMQAFLPWCAQ